MFLTLAALTCNWLLKPVNVRLFRCIPWDIKLTLISLLIHLIYIYIIQILSVCVCVCLSVCLSSIGGQTAGPIMTKFGTHMRIDLGMVPTKNWPHEWPGSVGSLGPISESGLSCQLLLRAVVWQMTSQLIRRRNDVVFAAFNQPVSVRPMNVQKINKTNFYPPHPGFQHPGGGGGQHFKSAGNFTTCRENR